VDIDIVDNGDGTVSLMYTPRIPGAYTLNIKFGGQPVPDGQILQQVGCMMALSVDGKLQITLNKTLLSSSDHLSYHSRT